MKLSARCIMNRVNLWHRIFSISSACLIFMLTRIELIEGSTSTRSFSLREMAKELRSTSFDDLMNNQSNYRSAQCAIDTYLTSTSGLLCRSTTCRASIDFLPSFIHALYNAPAKGSPAASTQQSMWTVRLLDKASMCLTRDFF